MKKFVYLATFALLSCSIGMAQSTDSNSQGTSATQNTQQTTSPTPPGDTRDKYGNTVAPDGSVTPKGTNTPFSKDSPPAPATGVSAPNSQGTSPTPPGDTRDKYGNTVAPDGSVTPRGANTPASKDSTPPPSMSNTQEQNDQSTRPTPPGDTRDKYGDTIAPDGSDTPRGANTPASK